MLIQWLGHACFKVTDLGQSVVFDPFSDGSVAGYRDVRTEANLVLCSHMHGDHNAAGNVTLLESEKSVFEVEALESFHDDKQGRLRGNNLIHIVSSEGFRFAHLGDLGHLPTPEQLSKLKDLDVLFIPVGGHFTIDGKMASEIVKMIHPKVTVPMHYYDGIHGYDVLGKVTDFTRYFDNVLWLSTDTLEFSDELNGEVVVFDYPEADC